MPAIFSMIRARLLCEEREKERERGSFRYAALSPDKNRAKVTETGARNTVYHYPKEWLYNFIE